VPSCRPRLVSRLPDCVDDVSSVESDVNLLVVVDERSVLGPTVHTTRYLLATWMLHHIGQTYNNSYGIL